MNFSELPVTPTILRTYPSYKVLNTNADYGITMWCGSYSSYSDQEKMHNQAETVIIYFGRTAEIG